MERSSLFIFHFIEEVVTAVFVLLLWLDNGMTSPVAPVLALALMLMALIATIWGMRKMSFAFHYQISVIVRWSILTGVIILVQDSEFLSGGWPWISLVTLLSILSVIITMTIKLRQKNIIIEQWVKSGKLDIAKRRFRLDVRADLLSEKDAKRLGSLSWVVVAAVVSGRLLSAFSPEVKTIVARLIFLGVAMGLAVTCGYVIVFGILLSRIEKKHGITLRTEYGGKHRS